MIKQHNIQTRNENLEVVDKYKKILVHCLKVNKLKDMSKRCDSYHYTLEEQCMLQSLQFSYTAGRYILSRENIDAIRR